jgi:hypothetical protein
VNRRRVPGRLSSLEQRVSTIRAGGHDDLPLRGSPPTLTTA